MKKESGVAGTRIHGRGSVPLMSKSDAIPLRHDAKTFDMGKTTKYIVTVCSNSNPIYICDTFGIFSYLKKGTYFKKQCPIVGNSPKKISTGFFVFNKEKNVDFNVFH